MPSPKGLHPPRNPTPFIFYVPHDGTMGALDSLCPIQGTISHYPTAYTLTVSSGDGKQVFSKNYSGFVAMRYEAGALAFRGFVSRANLVSNGFTPVTAAPGSGV